MEDPIWESERAQERLTIARDIESEISQIDGVEEALFATLAKNTGYQIAVLEVILETDDNARRIKIKPQLRSVIANITHRIRSNKDVATYSIAIRPEPVDTSSDVYDKDYYHIDIDFI